MGIGERFPMTSPSQLTAANNRRPFRLGRLREIRGSLAPSEVGSSAAVAEGGRSVRV